MIQLTDEQRQALQQTGEREPVPIHDPQSNQTHFLVPGALYERVRGQFEKPEVEDDLQIPQGIRRSKDAFLRDLPKLMASWWSRGKWAGYHGNERIAIRRDPQKIFRKIKQRGIPDDEYYVGLIRHHEPEPEEIDPSWAGFDWEEEDELLPPASSPAAESSSSPS